MTQRQRKYTEEFRRDTVKLMETSGKSVADIAKDMDIHQSVLRRWHKKFGQDHNGKNNQMELEEENKRLCRELRIMRQERDILKKAISIFSREQ